MKKGHKGAESETTAVGLRNQAEKKARIDESQTRATLSPEEARQALHELRVHQIELEIQNEELRRSQGELEAARARYFNFYDLAPVGYCTISEKGLILEANITIATMLGMARGTLLKRPLTAFILPEDHYIYYRNRKKLFETHSTSADQACVPQVCELRMVKKDGPQFWARLDATASQDPATSSGQAHVGARVCRIMMSDITERKRAEEAMRESEARYRKLIETTRDLIYTTDRKGFLTYINPTLERILGYAHHEWTGKTFAQIIAPELIDSVKDRFRRAMKGESIPVYEVDLIRKDGTRFSVEFNVTTLYDSEGKPLGRYGIGRDVTDRNRAEGEKLILQERLQRSEKMEALGTLAGGVAHDLNNVLGILVGYSELLLDDIEESSPAWTSIMEISRGSKRAAAIVEDMLTLARRGVQTRMVVNLNANLIACQKMPEFAKLSSVHPGVRISTNLEADLLNILGSPVHLDKTIMNLVSNAAEAMPGGGELTIRTTNQYLDKPIRGYDEVLEGDYVVLSVSDTGEGIAASDMKRIFEPFYTKKIMGRSGTGLGLAVVWGTVRDHHGYINVESEEGKGSVFTLYFPVTREEASRGHVSVPLSEYIGRDESILIVDDIKAQREVAARMLGKLNYRVTTVSSGEAAVEYLQDHKADLMVLDMIMDPGMDGLDTYKKVLEAHPNQKAVIVSGFSETDRVSQAQALGAGAYVRKPYIQERLGLAVRKELDKTA
jgi:PAS domain S-box-containing protein